MAYTLDREEAAKVLAVSTRTLDRYIKAWKIRSKKVGKKVFLESSDIDSLKNAPDSAPEVIVSSKDESPSEVFTSETSSADITFFADESSTGTKFRRKSIVVDYRELYEDARKSIATKDKIIQELSYKAGKAEADLKNSISLLEYKKTTFLLESIKTQSEEDAKKHEESIENFEKEIKKEKLISAFLLTATILLFIACGAIWFFSL